MVTVTVNVSGRAVKTIMRSCGGRRRDLTIVHRKCKPISESRPSGEAKADLKECGTGVHVAGHESSHRRGQAVQRFGPGHSSPGRGLAEAGPELRGTLPL